MNESVLTENFKTSEKKFASRYGYFSADGNEFVITTYKLQSPGLMLFQTGDMDS